MTEKIGEDREAGAPAPEDLDPGEKKLVELHPRYDWLDMARGLTILFLFIASFTWIFSGHLDANPPIKPIGPTWLNHGWKYFNGEVPIITIIDIGAQIFMFILGLSVPISFRSKLKKRGAKYAWTKVAIRVLAFFWITAVIDFSFGSDLIAVLGYILFIVTAVTCAYFGLVKYKNSDKKVYFGLLYVVLALISWLMIGADAGLTLWTVFFNEPLAHLAWGTLVATIAVALVDNPDKRIYIMAGLIFLHILLSILKIWMEMNGIPTSISAPGTMLNGLKIPFDVIGHAAIAVGATSVSDWILRWKSPIEGIRERVIKFSLLNLLFAVCWDFFQPADHHGTNAALVMMTLGATSAFVILFYALENYYKIKIPLLTALGRNALFLYLFQGIFTIPYDNILDLNAEKLWALGYPWGPLVGFLLFLLAMGVCIGMGLFLHKKKIYIKL